MLTKIRDFLFAKSLKNVITDIAVFAADNEYSIITPDNIGDDEEITYIQIDIESKQIYFGTRTSPISLINEELLEIQ